MSHLNVSLEDLAELGFGSYRDYLISDYWREIRLKVLDRDGWKCVRCGANAHSAAHLSHTLKVLRGEDLGELVSICGPCHMNHA